MVPRPRRERACAEAPAPVSASASGYHRLDFSIRDAARRPLSFGQRRTRLGPGRLPLPSCFSPCGAAPAPVRARSLSPSVSDELLERSAGACDSPVYFCLVVALYILPYCSAIVPLPLPSYWPNLFFTLLFHFNFILRWPNTLFIPDSTLLYIRVREHDHRPSPIHPSLLPSPDPSTTHAPLVLAPDRIRTRIRFYLPDLRAQMRNSSMYDASIVAYLSEHK